MKKQNILKTTIYNNYRIKHDYHTSYHYDEEIKKILEDEDDDVCLVDVLKANIEDFIYFVTLDSKITNVETKIFFETLDIEKYLIKDNDNSIVKILSLISNDINSLNDENLFIETTMFENTILTHYNIIITDYKGRTDFDKEFLSTETDMFDSFVKSSGFFEFDDLNDEFREKYKCNLKNYINFIEKDLFEEFEELKNIEKSKINISHIKEILTDLFCGGVSHHIKIQSFKI